MGENLALLNDKKIEMSIESIIEKAVKKATNVIKFKEHRDKQIKRTPFKKTEELLYNYAAFMESIELKRQQIKTIKEYGCINKSKSVVKFDSTCSSLNIKDLDEKAEEQIQELEYRINNIKKFINVIDDALAKIKTDPYYEIILLKYVKNNTYEEIAEKLDKDVSTISRNKNRLINKLKTFLFAEEVLQDIFLSI